MPESSSTAPVADSPALQQLRARKKMLEHKIAHRIPQSADRKEESLARANQHLAQVKEQIKALDPASKKARS